MTAREATYKLLCIIRERKVVSAETINAQLHMLDSSFLTSLLNHCRQMGYIVNTPIHKGSHQIGTIDSNQYQITFFGLSYLEQYEQEKSQQRWAMLTIVITAIILPIVIAIYSK